MRAKQIANNPSFIGREQTVHQLHQITKSSEANIIILYGRRRIGKTELLEQTFRKRQLLKFEGIEGGSQAEQMVQVMMQLGEYAEQPLLRDVKVTSWVDVFRYMGQCLKEGEWTLYLEEVQWLASYKEKFVSELKYAWDNYFRHNRKLILILCGSSPSFMINKVIQSKSLYNRSQHEIALKQFNLIETQQFLKKYSIFDVMDAYLTLGGIPEYLKRIKTESSLWLGICKNAFRKDAYFTREYQKIFISSLAKNPQYQVVIEFLSRRKFATRQEIASHLKLQSGGRLTELLVDLEQCDFIEKYVPYNLSQDTTLVRYGIKDNYLQFYFKFIKSKLKQIDLDQYKRHPSTAIKQDTYRKWLGYAFERFCRLNAPVIAARLGFAAINYISGAYYSRMAQSKLPGFQIDLLFDRDDHVLTVCEIKYTKSKIKRKVIQEVETKLALLPNTKNKTIHKVLICCEGVEDSLHQAAYFDDIICLEELFDPHYW